MSFAIPAGEQPPVVIDMALDLGVIGGISQDQLFQHIPAAFFKFIGLGATAPHAGWFYGLIQMHGKEPTKAPLFAPSTSHVFETWKVSNKKLIATKKEFKK